MKKLLMFAAVAACVVQAQAATVSGLGYQSNTGYDGGLIDETTIGYYTVYSLSRADLESVMGDAASELGADTKAKSSGNIKVVNAWLADNLSRANALRNASTQWEVVGMLDARVTKGATTADLMSARLVNGTYAANQWVITFYDNENTHYVRIANAWNGGTQDTAVEGNELGLTAGEFVVCGGNNGKSNTKWGSWTAVPEPTSGLLMLLGLAGLALKRKRA